LNKYVNAYNIIFLNANNIHNSLLYTRNFTQNKFIFPRPPCLGGSEILCAFLKQLGGCPEAERKLEEMRRPKFSGSLHSIGGWSFFCRRTKKKRPKSMHFSCTFHASSLHSPYSQIVLRKNQLNHLTVTPTSNFV
jgi:hypothetical protein